MVVLAATDEDVEEAIEKLEEEERETEEAESELAEAEQEATSPSQEENLAELGKKIEGQIKEEDKLVGIGVSRIEDKIQQEERQLSEISEEEEAAYEQFKNSIQNLRELLEELESRDFNSQQMVSAFIEDFRAALSGLRTAAQPMPKVFNAHARVLERIERGEEEAIQLEQDTEVLGEELGALRQQLEEMDIDFQQLGDQEGYKEITNEEELWEKLVSEAAQNVEAETDLEDMIEEEVQESEKIAEDEREIHNMADEAVGLIEKIDERIKQDRFLLKSVSDTNLNQEILKTNEALKQVINPDRTGLDKITGYTKDTIELSNRLHDYDSNREAIKSASGSAGSASTSVLKFTGELTVITLGIVTLLTVLYLILVI